MHFVSFANEWPKAVRKEETITKKKHELKRKTIHIFTTDNDRRNTPTAISYTEHVHTYKHKYDDKG